MVEINIGCQCLTQVQWWAPKRKQYFKKTPRKFPPNFNTWIHEISFNKCITRMAVFSALQISSLKQLYKQRAETLLPMRPCRMGDAMKIYSWSLDLGFLGGNRDFNSLCFVQCLLVRTLERLRIGGCVRTVVGTPVPGPQQVQYRV